MSTKLHLISVLVAGLASHGAAMPTEAEVEKAVPKVERMLASEKVALESGKMTRAEVAAAAMKLAAGADDEAAKLLLMKGAFILHVKDGDLEKAVKTMNALETAIADMPPQVVTNIIETALLGLSNKAAHGARLYRLLDESKADATGIAADGENLKAVVGGYTWSYRVKNGEAEIVAEKDGKFVCAVSPSPKGSVVIPETLDGATVRIIGQNAFRDCGGLTSILIPSAVTSIRENAFYGCLGLNALTIPPAVREIGNEAFESCRELAAVTLPSSVVRVGRGIFADCTGLKQIDVEEGNPNYTSVDGVLYTKDRTELWMWPAGQRRVTIPDHVRVIGQWAFLKFDGLKSLTIPSTVTSIGWGAFQGCDGLVSVTIPSSVGSIDGCAFRECGGLTSVTMEEGVTNIGRAAFCDCSELKSVVLPSALTRLDSNVFRGCRGLTAVTIPPNVTSIGWCAFCDCSGLKSVTIPSSVTSIGGCAFFRCGELSSVSIPESVTSIGREAFRFCRALESVTIPSNLKILEQGVFASTGLKSVTIPTNVTSIGRGAVAGCVDLAAVAIPDSVTNIGIDAFRGSGRVKSVTIPSSVRSISDHAFAVCGELTTVTMRGERPTAPNNIFEGCGKLTSIHVPANCKSWAGMIEWQGIPLVFDGADGIKDSSSAVHKSVESILKGMVKVPGRDYWLSATELTQEQWEPIMEYNLSEHNGAKLPVEMVSRDDCDVFIEKLNQTKEVKESQFEFCLPTKEEWLYADHAGGTGNECWVKPGIAGNVLDMAWLKENSSNQTHVVATKAANAFGFYDMVGNVWEWTSECDEKDKKYYSRGASYGNDLRIGVEGWYWLTPSSHRRASVGLRLAAHKKVERRPLLGGLRRLGTGGGLLRRTRRQQEAQKSIRQEKVDGYTWSFFVNNGEAEIVADGKSRCAVSPSPTGCITIPLVLGGAKVTSIGREVFKGCRGVSSVTIPGGVASIGPCAFEGCGELISVTMPECMTNIGRYAFKQCAKLTSLAIPEGVKSIGHDAFVECRGLTSLNLPTSLTSIGNDAFRACSNLMSVTIPANVESIGRYAFRDCPKLATIKIQDGVTNIGWDSFCGCSGLESVSIPSSVTNIGPWAFSGCVKLKSLTIPSSVKNIERAAFSACRGLESVTIPPSVTSVGWDVFKDCDGLKSVTIPESVTEFGVGAFAGCRMLESVTVPSNVTNIGAWAFCGCDAMKQINVVDENRRFASVNGVLYTKDCTELVQCPNGLESVTIPEYVTSIRAEAFRGCEKLTMVTIPANVSNVGGAAFAYCGSLRQINVDAGNYKYASVDGVLYTKNLAELVMAPGGMRSVTIPECVTSIGSFKGCSGLASVTIPAKIDRILPWTFEGCKGLASVTIEGNITHIGCQAFWFCRELTSVTMRGERPSAPNNIFQECGKLKSIHVPANAKSWAGMTEWQGIPLVFDAK